ncbi:MAG TPA: CoA transferase [Caulobacteraceae bacterium]|jgi:crotonobetainyl-CoA:carnitine CoA-transferase CaiB-like acyl-CoA transferase
MSAYKGLKIVDCSQGVVGPMAAMLMADFGAEVLKVEPPGGDRYAARPGYQMFNRNKRRLTLDLDDPAGRAKLEDLLAAADLAIFDFGPKRMAALGLLDAHERHPRLVRLWTPPYGTTGDLSEMEGHHAILMALTGSAWRQSSYEDRPVYLIASVLHYAQAAMAAGSAGAALLERRKSGRGQGVTVSGFNAVGLVGGASGNFLPPGRKPLGASPSYRTYKCGDGEYLFLATLFSYFFKRALNAMGLTEIALAEEVFPEEVTVAMEAKFLEKSRAEWLDILRVADVPAGPVGKREEWLGSELIANNDMRVEMPDPERGPVEMPGVPIKLKSTPGEVRSLVQDAKDADVAAFLAASGDKPAVGAEPPKAGPLAGIKVLDLGTVIAGAYCNAILGNLGAEVVKVESAEGDPWRDREAGFTAYNRGKRGLVVDLKQPAGRDLFLDLAKQADVVLDNYRLGVRDRLGIGHDAVRAANPRIVSGSITTYGSRGEETKRPGFDPLLQARSGLMAAQGGDNDEPVFHIIAVNDFASAAMASFGVITALNARELTGEGQVLETSLTNQSAMFQSADLTTWPGAPPAPKGSRDCLGIAALDRFYATATGWILIACANAAEAKALTGALHHPEWTDKYDLLAEPRDGALAEEIAAALRSLSVDTALAALTGAGVRAVPARLNEETIDDPWLAENHFFDKTVETPYGPVVNRPYASFTRSTSGYDRPDPGLGEHSFEVLADWGIDPERTASLADEGVVMVLC